MSNLIHVLHAAVKRVATKAAICVPDDRCWVIALSACTGLSAAAVKKVALRNSWDGKSWGLALKHVVSSLWEILRYKPTITLAHNHLTPKNFSGETRDDGLVFVDGHVMPLVNGKVSNFCGHGEQKIVAVVTTKRA